MSIMVWGMKFTDKISIVTISWTPGDEKLLLVDATVDSVEAHVNSFSGFLLDAIVGEANSGCIVDLDGRGRLGMAHFGERNTDGEGVASREEGRGDFGFGSGAHYVREDFGEGVDSSVRDKRMGRGLRGVR